jgi:DNA-binding IclR family transcriptional regulator
MSGSDEPAQMEDGTVTQSGTPADPGAAAPRAQTTAGLRLQTLIRGLAVMELLADGRALSVAQIARAVGLHRSVTYRIVRTLDDRDFLERQPDGRYRLGLAVASLARTVRSDLTNAALPELAALAEATGTTAFVTVPSGEDAVTLVAMEPRQSDAHVSRRPGQRHPLDRGAPGLAILAALPPRPGERLEVEFARVHGYAKSTSEVVPGFSSLAAPLRFVDSSVASLALVFIAGDLDEDAAIEGLRRHAHRLQALVPGRGQDPPAHQGRAVAAARGARPG